MLTHRLQSPDSRLRVFRHVSVRMQICMCVCCFIMCLSVHVCIWEGPQSLAALLLKPLCKILPVTLGLVYSVGFYPNKSTRI